MKILKIELQNLNSLQSDTPVVIDFESDIFLDTGLYAITGPTGSGKTTLLDAITIALYRQVPRLKYSPDKTLESVISYNADHGFARVTFSVQQQKFEASWSMQMKGKNGKPLANPREEVRLKNLSTAEILAEKKTEMTKKVEEITQLNYDQFLRSVVLAQGEFAAFLSAKNDEKGKLLEKIAGEEIYKKIGEQVQQNIREERSTLMKISARIQEDDLLTPEEKAELTKEENKLIAEQKKQESDQQNTQKLLEKRREHEQEKTHLTQEISAKERQKKIYFHKQETKQQEKKQLEEEQKKGDEFLSTEHLFIEKISEIEKNIPEWKSDFDKRKEYKTQYIELKKSLKTEEKKHKENLVEQEKQEASSTEIAEIFQKILEEIKIQEEKQEKTSLQILLDDQKTKRELQEYYRQNIRLLGEFSEYEISEKKNKTMLEEKEKTLLETKNTLEIVRNDEKNALIFLADAEKIVERDQKIQGLSEYRKHLKEGEECLLCGSLHHPKISEYQEREISEAQKIRDERKQQLEKIQSNIHTAETRRQVLEEAIQTLSQQCEEGENKKQKIQGNIDLLTEKIRKTLIFLQKKSEKNIKFLNPLTKEECEKQQKSLESKLSLGEEKISAYQKAEKTLKQLHLEKEHTQQKIAQHQSEKARRSEQIKNTASEMLRIENEMKTIRASGETLKDKITNSFQEFQNILDIPETQDAGIFIQNLQEKIRTIRSYQQKKIEFSGLINTCDAEIKNFQESRIQEETAQNILQKKYSKISASLEGEEEKNALPFLQEQEKIIKTALENILKKRGEIQQKWTKQHEIETRHSKIEAEKKAQEKVLKKWETLMQVLGGTTDKFNAYVQRLTLKNMINMANIHLNNLNPRYSLGIPETYKKGSELEFHIIDAYQNDEVRKIESASGGEKFLLSLALALGLSDLSSKNIPIESLFIDEGFGTLDAHTLETVISTLETLQMQKNQQKHIGIISHVDALKERIGLQIEISKKTNGVSELTIL